MSLFVSLELGGLLADSSSKEKPVYEFNLKLTPVLI